MKALKASEDNSQEDDIMQIHKNEGFSCRLVSIPKIDLESLEATVETLENRSVMEQLENSELDIRKGRTRRMEDFIKELEA